MSFFTGTAAEVTPIRSVDRITVGNGGRGPITEKVQKLFFEMTKGERKAPGEWLTYVNKEKQATPTPDGFHGRGLETSTEDTAPILFTAVARD